MAKIDFKVTVWESFTIDDSLLPEVIEKIKSGEISSSEDLINQYDNEISNEGVDYETMEQMTPEENDNQSTIEIIKGEKTIFTNEIN